jgi:hypothetical protein
MGNDRDEKSRDSGLDEDGPESMGPLAAPDPERGSDTNAERGNSDEEDVREQIRATPNE